MDSPYKFGGQISNIMRDPIKANMMAQACCKMKKNLELSRMSETQGETLGKCILSRSILRSNITRAFPWQLLPEERSW